MASISLCMIVKNEEKNLARCLDGYRDYMDEIIIVDTGSTDKTKEIAAKYTDKIYDFKWVDDFSKARNYAFSLASCEYIFSADADEVLEGENREKFRILKENLLPEIEIVQMYYGNQLSQNTVYNFDKELRPKLFRRLRTFRWTEPIHETVALDPLVYDSDIVITHKPHDYHGKRDLAVFYKMWQRGEYISKRLHSFYARELMVAGDLEDFNQALPFFLESVQSDRSLDELKEACVVLAKAYLLRGDITGFYKYVMKDISTEGCSESCFLLGQFYEGQGDFEEALTWYQNALEETEPILNIKYGEEYPRERIEEILKKMGESYK